MIEFEAVVFFICCAGFILGLIVGAYEHRLFSNPVSSKQRWLGFPVLNTECQMSIDTLRGTAEANAELECFEINHNTIMLALRPTKESSGNWIRTVAQNKGTNTSITSKCSLGLTIAFASFLAVPLILQVMLGTPYERIAGLIFAAIPSLMWAVYYLAARSEAKRVLELLRVSM